MQAAKNAISGFTSKVGSHDTTVHETVAPSVTQDTVNTHHHENVTTAIDREVHQDHHHTTVQPVHDQKTLAETHHHNAAPVEHRKFEHGNDADVQARLKQEQAQFKDTTTKGETKHTSSVQPTVGGERIHHHVHENIQPVIHRQVIEPHVTHTTVPIHETHHAAAKHHNTSALPAVSMADFKNGGGILEGRETKSQFYQGEPKGHEGHSAFTHKPDHEFRNTGHTDKHSTTGGLTSGTGHSDTRSTDEGLSSSSGVHQHHGHGNHAGAGSAAAATGAAATGLASSRDATSHHTTGSATDRPTGIPSGIRTGDSTTSGSTSGLGSNGTTTGSNTTAANGVGSASLAGATERTSAGHGTSHDRHDSSNVTDTTKTKPSLLDRLNPLKDADGDGKKGLMD